MLGALRHRVLIEAPLQFHAVAHVSRDGAPRQQAGMLEDDGTIDTRPVDLPAGDADQTLIVRQKTGDDVQQRGLTAAAGSDDGEEFSVGYGD